jgi:predicted dehydrogenase
MSSSAVTLHFSSASWLLTSMPAMPFALLMSKAAYRLALCSPTRSATMARNSVWLRWAARASAAADPAYRPAVSGRYLISWLRPPMGSASGLSVKTGQAQCCAVAYDRRVTSFAVVGAGWRASAYLRLAACLEDVSCVGVVVRSPRRLPVPAFTSLAECLTAVRPDFLVTAVPRAVNPDVVRQAVDHGVPVLSETPPAPDLAGLRMLWHNVGRSGLVQVAEQYLLMPSHAARLAAVRSGVIGAPAQVQVSSTQLYHAVSLIRGLLGVGRSPVTVRASRHEALLVDPSNRAGWTDDHVPKLASTTIATLDFGQGRSGLYDFTDNQTRNQLRFRRILVRGSHGELYDDEIVRLAAPRTIVRVPLTRRQTGHDLDLQGFDTEHIALGADVMFRNPYAGLRFNDDEIATAALLQSTAAWVRGDGPPPYPLAEGAHDHLVALAIEEAADTGRTVTTTVEPWA